MVNTSDMCLRVTTVTVCFQSNVECFIFIKFTLNQGADFKGAHIYSVYEHVTRRADSLTDISVHADSSVVSLDFLGSAIPSERSLSYLLTNLVCSCSDIFSVFGIICDVFCEHVCAQFLLS